MNNLPLTEELDFAYLLTLLPPLYEIPQFAWLPELFSIIGYERLIKLCRYCGGETIQIPTSEQIADAIDALQWFYDVEIKHSKCATDVPIRLRQLYADIVKVYSKNAR